LTLERISLRSLPRRRCRHRRRCPGRRRYRERRRYLALPNRRRSSHSGWVRRHRQPRL